MDEIEHQKRSVEDEKLAEQREEQEKIARAKRQKDFSSKFTGSSAPKVILEYTGTEMIGIAQGHKTNAQPVFNKQSAIDMAQMRR